MRRARTTPPPDNADGSLKSIAITTYAKFTQQVAGQTYNVPLNASVDSDYYVTVSYPRVPYYKPSNIPLVKEKLTNTATLEYSLETDARIVTRTANATIELGEKEPPTAAQRITVKKQLKLGDQTFTLDKSAVDRGYARARFSLYMDESCTVPATDINGDTIDPALVSNVQTADDGTVTFENLRYGTYYLKEEVVPKGFAAPSGGVTKVALQTNGKVVYGSGGTPQEQVVLTNEATPDGMGIVAFWKIGRGAGGADTAPLAGVTFALRNTATGETKEATSDADGYVRFDAVPAGVYEITETSVGSHSGEYGISNTKKTVTVVGNQINYPATDAGATPQMPAVFLNESEKGKFQLTKLDVNEPSKKLAGAKFQLYGPYSDDTLAAPPDADIADAGKYSVVTVGSDGTYTSGALAQGKYFLRESQAPSGYKLDDTWYGVTVVKNSTAAVTAYNEAYARVAIYKYGVLGGGLYKVGLSGVRFRIFDAETGGSMVLDSDMVTSVDATGNPNTPFAELPAGTYWYEEVASSVPAGYTPIAGRTSFTLTAGQNLTIPVDNATYYGQFVFHKVDARTNLGVAGAVFSVYSDPACDAAHLVDTVAVDAGGKGVSRLLPVGKYWVKETTIPAGYYQGIDIIRGVDAGGLATGAGDGLDIAADTQSTVTVKNDPAVRIRITKKDEDTSAAGAEILIDNATFKLYPTREDAQNDTNGIAKTTANGGVLVFDGLEPGKTYYYKETSAPEGYILDGRVAEIQAPLASEDAVKNVTVTNKHYATLKLSKTGQMDNANANLAGAVFHLYPRRTLDAAADKGNVLQDQIIVLTTLADGTASKDNVAPGDYWLEEFRAPDGYALPAPAAQAIIVSSGENTAGYRANVHNIVNTASMGKVTVKKVNSYTGAGLAAVFDLYKKNADGSYVVESSGQIATSAADGVGVSTWLEPGTYGVKETRVTGDYVMDEGYHDVLIEEGKTAHLGAPLTIENVPKGKILIQKHAKWSLTPTGGAQEDVRFVLGGATFEIYQKTGPDSTFAEDAAGGQQSPNFVQTLTTSTADGQALSDPLAPGAYWVMETRAPENYELPSPNEPAVVSVGVDGATVEHAFDNTPARGRIKIYKWDLGTKRALDGANFALYQEDPAGQAYVIDGVTKYLSMVQGTGDIQTGTIEGETGTALTIELDPDQTYYLRELQDSPLLQDGYLMVREWTGPIQVSAGAITPVDVDNYKPAKPPGYKQDEAGNGMAGVWVGVFASVADAQNMQQFLSSVTITDEQMQSVDFRLNLAQTHNIAGLARSTEPDGAFTFQNLVPTRTYYALEITTTPNYVRDAGIHTVKVNGAGDGFEATLTIVNSAYRHILVRKVTELSGVTYNVNGVTFTVYKAVPTDVPGVYTRGAQVASGVTGTGGEAEGYYKSILLPPGVYIVVETAVPDGFTIDKTERVVTLEATQDNTDLVDTPVVNVASYGRFALKKVDRDSNATQLNATFRVEKVGDGAFAPFTFTTDKTKDYYLSALLPAGTYRISEQSVEAGYTNAGAAFDITIEGGKITDASGVRSDVVDDAHPIDPIAVANAKQGKLEIEKYGVWMDAREGFLNGVTFRLYKSETGDAAVDCGADKAYREATTSGNLKATISNLDEGDYWLKEHSVGSNSAYAANLAPIPVHITAGATTALTGDSAVENTTIYGKLRIIKEDAHASEVKLAGAKFDIFDNAQCTGVKYGTLETDAQGQATSPLLDPGKNYYLKETRAPQGYMYTDGAINGPYSVAANSLAAYTIKNDKAQTVEIYKYYEDAALAKHAIQGAKFQLYATQADALAGTNPLFAQDQTTNANGLVSFAKLKPLTDYYLVERQPAQGYVANPTPVRVTTDNTGAKRVEIANIPQGKIKLQKLAHWVDAANVHVTVPVEDAVFDIYKWNGDVATGTRGEKLAMTIATDAQGVGLSGWLDPGAYELVEQTPPEGFDFDPNKPNSYKVQVDAGEVDQTYVGDANAIYNVPNRGRFTLEKHITGTQTPISGAVFELYREDDATPGQYTLYDPANPTFTVDGSYTSGMLPQGNYMVKEVQAPAGYTITSPAEHTFTITSGATVRFVVYNDAQGVIKLTKRGDAQNGSPLLTGAVFQLYKGSVAAENKVQGEKTTADGVISWKNLDAGTYVVHEVSAPDGYKISDTDKTIVVSPGASTHVTYDAAATNASDKGRVVISKVNSLGQPLSGAVFEVWRVDAQNDPVEKVAGPLTTSGGIAMSGLLPAAQDGTRYLVKEIQAPDGYTLDGRFQPTSKLVTVYPLHAPQNDQNKVTFENVPIADITAFTGVINKSIADDAAQDSLLMQPFTTTFSLRDYAHGENNVPMDSFTVTDNAVAMQYYESVDSVTPVNKTIAAGDYAFNTVRIYRAGNAAGGAVRARVEYQTFSQLGTDDWTPLSASYTKDDLQNLQSGHFEEVSLDGALPQGVKAMGVRVVYEGVGKAFSAEGIDLDVTFAQRAGGASEHEIRRVTNVAKLSYNYSELDPFGTPARRETVRSSNQVVATIPLLEVAKTRVSLTNTPTGSMFFPGNPVEYTLLATNESADTPFKDPVISMDLPGYTSLDQFYAGGKTFTFRSSMGRPLTPRISYEYNVPASKLDPATGNVVEAAGVTTTRAVFTFDDVQLQPGEHIEIKYQVYIAVDKPAEVTQLLSPAYLSSAYRLPLSAENPTGVSFENHLGALVENPDLDDKVNDETGLAGKNQYVNANANITVHENNVLNIYKFVKGPLNADYLPLGQVASTYPGGDVDYKIRLYNGSTSPIKTARIIDILPFTGDSYALRNVQDAVARATDIPGDMLLKGVNAPGATIYYSTADWSAAARNAKTPAEELPMAFGAASDWSGWSTTPPADMGAVTAIGVEITFTDDALMKERDAYEIEVHMQAPGFTGEQIDDYIGKLIANSAMGAVVRSGNTGTDIQMEDRVENVQVLCNLDLPLGSIGDYVFLDNNRNGIQDDGDTFVAGAPVLLHQKKTTVGGTTETTQTTMTDANGKYLFADLPCNYLKTGAPQGSTDPRDYVGETYYSYRVEFTSPDAGYAVTARYAGDDRAIDSNIDENYFSEEITLRVTLDALGVLHGEDNDTIDAGFITASALGNRVWMDENRNGIQDPGEPGVNGVTVNLYRADVQGNIGPVIYRSTTTQTVDGEAGVYWFEGLLPGKYAVEFDITHLKNTQGIYEFAFTDAGQGSSGVDDSDADIVTDQSDRIRRSAVIDLPVNTRDGTWDAGLITYSALGGYAFDDRDYDDVQSIGIPLPGTVVTLYRVVDGLREETPLRPAVTVGADGRYFFDRLEEGQYQLHFDFPDGYRAVKAHMDLDDTQDSDVEMELAQDLNQGYTPVINLGYNTVDTTWDAGACLLGSIGDYVWYDRNKDGIQGTDETPIADVPVVLQQRRGEDDLWRFYEETATDARGYYRFDNLKCGPDSGYAYRVIFGFEADAALTVTGAGSNGALDSDAIPIYLPGWGFATAPIALGYGQSDMTWDAGIVTARGSVGDFVWFDANQNGLQEDTEIGIAGIEVVLEHSASDDIIGEGNWLVVGATVTNQAGYYRFDDLDAGYYRVRFNIPAMYQVTTPNAGDFADAYVLDSDASRAAGGNAYYARPFYLEQGGFDMTWDAGVYLNDGASVRTGDAGAPGGYLALLLLALTGMGVSIFQGKKERYN
nr:SpaA isopeptide-forming pilin-related protein [Maliibacterium massiliense]